MARFIKKSPVFVVVEGLDGSGKSTLAKTLSELLPAELLRTPPECFRVFRQVIDREYYEFGLAAQLFYASTVVFASKSAERLLKRDRSVVLDRYWLSTEVYANFRNERVDLSLLENRLLRPSLTIFLDIDDEERLKRMKQRGPLTIADWDSVKKQSALRRAYRKALNRPIVGKPMVLNTTKRDPRECAEAVICELRGRVAA